MNTSALSPAIKRFTDWAPKLVPETVIRYTAHAANSKTITTRSVFANRCKMPVFVRSRLRLIEHSITRAIPVERADRKNKAISHGEFHKAIDFIDC